MDDWAKQRLAELHAAAPIKRKKPEQFVKVPTRWVEELGPVARGTTWYVACHLLHLAWKNHGRPFKLPNRILKCDRHAKYRALDNLERRGLIAVERHSRKSPTIRAYT
jgi:hypothetical protein